MLEKMTDNKRELLMAVLKAQPDLVVAGGIWTIYQYQDTLELYAALKEPRKYLQGKNYQDLTRRINVYRTQLKMYCGNPTDADLPSLYSERAEPAEIALSAARLGFTQRLRQEHSLSDSQQEILNSWSVVRNLPGNAFNLPQNFVQSTELYIYPHPLIAEVQAPFHVQSSTAYGVSRGDKKANRRRPDLGVTKEALELLVENPEQLLDNVRPIV